MALRILGRIRNVYLALHPDTDSAPIRFSASTGDEDDILWEPFSYPVCNIPGLHPDPTPHIYDISDTTDTPRAVLHDDTALVAAPLASTPVSPPSSVRAPFYVGDNLMDVPLPDNNISVLSSFHQTITERLRKPAISPAPAVATGARDVHTFARLPPVALETPTSPSSVGSIGAISLRNNAAILAHPDAPEISSSVSPEPVLDKILPTGPSLSLTLP